MDWRGNAMQFIPQLLEDGEVLPLQDILDAILRQQLQNLEQLEEFLEEHEDRFFMENGRVALRDPELEETSVRAVSYFEDELERYNERPNYMNFRGHIGQAEDDVKYFINDFYPQEEFKNFLEAHPDVFIVFDDDTVSLTENECANYFRDCLQNDEGIHFRNLRGHIGQSERYIINYINSNYPEENFVHFLEKNSDIFYVDEDGCVFLNQDNDD